MIPNSPGRPLIRTALLALAGAVTAALALTTAHPAAPTAAPEPRPQGATADGAPLLQQAATDGTGLSPLLARGKDGRLWDYEPKGTGGWKARVDMGGGYSSASALVQAGISDSGRGNDLYFRMGGTLYYTAERGNETKRLGTGWDQYNLLVSVANMAGSAQPDLVARGTDGQLWLYQGKADGTLSARIRMKDSTGWNGMSLIAGRGDYTGDGIADLVTRNSAGNLLIYPGTGKATADAVLGTSTSLGNVDWKDYTALVSTGDNNGDGKADLMAVDAAGALWLYKGTGTAGAPFSARTQIGTSGWTQYNLLF
ncbi:FG-GAP-like repeat-containing protein [Streptomyces griseorubiginosus]|uniref:FG-GAP repeat domain-containing protein n=1 Tax=Streptomyces griseorubiginosus TaxID=67304 RepID=UPI0036E61ACC